MEIKFIGTGGAFDYNYGNSSAWIYFQSKHILLDCGHTVYARLREHNLVDKIDFFLLTHCHDDHIGSLSTTILHQQFLQHPPKKAQILVPSEAFKNELLCILSPSLITPEEYVDFHLLDILPGLSGIDTTNLHVDGMLSYGYRFEDKDEIVFYSGDIGNTEIILESVPVNPDKSVRVFHDMSFEENDGIHTYYQLVCRWVDKFTIYAYHLDPREAPTDNTVPLVIHQPELLL